MAIGLLRNVNGGKISLVRDKAEEQIQAMGGGGVNELRNKEKE
jgi:stage V sporulation protein SpoVS